MLKVARILAATKPSEFLKHRLFEYADLVDLTKDFILKTIKMQLLLFLTIKIFFQFLKKQ
jgi:hypothetical protein